MLVGPYLVLVLIACGAVEIAATGRARLEPRGPRVVVALPVLAAGAVSVGGLGALAWVAFKVGALSYGGGFVIVPLMQHDAVHTYHWMSSSRFLDAVALGQVTPGPVVATVAAVGYAAHGIGGGVLAALVAFAPSFAFVLGGRWSVRPAAGERPGAVVPGRCGPGGDRRDPRCGDSARGGAVAVVAVACCSAVRPWRCWWPGVASSRRLSQRGPSARSSASPAARCRVERRARRHHRRRCDAIAALIVRLIGGAPWVRSGCAAVFSVSARIRRGVAAEADHLLDSGRAVGVPHREREQARHERDPLAGRIRAPGGRVAALPGGELVARRGDRRPELSPAPLEVAATAVADGELAADLVAEDRAQVLVHVDVPAGVLPTGGRSNWLTNEANCVESVGPSTRDAHALASSGQAVSMIAAPGSVILPMPLASVRSSRLPPC